MKKHTAALSAAAVTVLSAAGAMKLNDALFRPEVPPPGEVDLPCRRLSVPSGDVLLSGALLGEEGPRGRLLLAHDMGVSWDYYLPEIRRFVALGYQVLTFSYRGYPGSGGRFRGFPQAARDVAAGAALRARDGLDRRPVPTLILQGSRDDEVTPEGCALYAHRTEVKNPNARFHLLSAEGSDGHMTLIRRKGERDVNPDTFPLVEAFLTEAL